MCCLNGVIHVRHGRPRHSEDALTVRLVERHATPRRNRAGICYLLFVIFCARIALSCYVYNVITRHAGRRAVAQGLKRVHVRLALMGKGCKLCKKPAGASMGKGSKVCKKPAGHCCARRISKQVSASSDKVSFKRTVAALASQLVLKRSASGGGSKTRVQLKGERVHCSLEKCDDLAQALKSLRGIKQHWQKKDWSNAVKRKIRMCDWGALGHGGYRHGCRQASAAETSPSTPP